MGLFSTCKWLLRHAGFSLCGEMTLLETAKGLLFHWDAHLPLPLTHLETICATTLRGLGALFPQLQTPHAVDMSFGRTGRRHQDMSTTSSPAPQSTCTHLWAPRPSACQPHHTPIPIHSGTRSHTQRHSRPVPRACAHACIPMHAQEHHAHPQACASALARLCSCACSSCMHFPDDSCAC